MMYVALGDSFTAGLEPGQPRWPDELARRLDLELGGEPVLLRYKPRARAVLRWGEHVLKAYGNRGAFDLALTGLRADSPLRTLLTRGDYDDSHLDTALRSIVPPLN